VRTGRTIDPWACDGVAELDVKCSEVLEQLSDFLDADAREELCRAIEQHLARCGRCRVHVDTVRKTILLYHIDGPAEVPVRVSAALESALAREYQRSRHGSPAD
jgi:predicted anti-sigma-YlaC factor YlaD